MSDVTIKPETPCMCNGDCQNKPHTFECADAVRMVTVPTPMDARLSMNVPMCAPCAEHHEAKAGAR